MMSLVFTCDAVRPLSYSYTMLEPEQQQQIGPNQCHLLLLQHSHNLQGYWLWGLSMECTLTADETVVISMMTSEALTYACMHGWACLHHHHALLARELYLASG